MIEVRSKLSRLVNNRNLNTNFECIFKLFLNVVNATVTTDDDDVSALTSNFNYCF